MKKNTRMEFPLPVVLTLVTGVFMCSKIEHVFSCASYIVGYPIAQHELADHKAALKRAILAQHPGLANVEPIRPDRRDAATFIPKYVERQIATFGETLLLTRGTAERTESPVDSLRRRAPHMDIITIIDDTSPRATRA